MPSVVYHCKNCEHKSAFTWHERCPICNINTSMARCSDCSYRGSFKEFWDKGCPKCAGTSILAGESSSFDEKLPNVLGLGTFFIVFLVLFIGISFIYNNWFGLSQAGVDISDPWYFWFSFTVGGAVGLLVRFKLVNKLKIKQKAREIEARDKNLRPKIAGSKKEITGSTAINNKTLPKIAMTPGEMSNDKKIRSKIKKILSELPIVEHQNLSECRLKMINQAGSIHPSMHSGSLENTVNFVVRMIHETENFILSCKGIVKVEKAFVISDWPIRRPVLEIQYEQFWDNNTSNVYSEHVMRIGIDEYEIFGSKKSHDRMKAIWKE